MVEAESGRCIAYLVRLSLFDNESRMLEVELLARFVCTQLSLPRDEFRWRQVGDTVLQ